MTKKLWFAILAILCFVFSYFGIAFNFGIPKFPLAAISIGLIFLTLSSVQEK